MRIGMGKKIKLKSINNPEKDKALADRAGIDNAKYEQRTLQKSILDISFSYTPSHKTDLKKLFARIRREQQATQQPTATVTPLKATGRAR